MCVLCWSFTSQPGVVLPLPPSSVFENSDYICWFYKGIVSSRVLHKVMAVLLRAHQVDLSPSPLPEKMRPRLGNISNAAVRHPSAYRQRWLLVCTERAHSLGSETREKLAFSSWTLVDGIHVLKILTLNMLPFSHITCCSWKPFIFFIRSFHFLAV